MKNILILGANGQIGTELTIALRKKHTNEQVIACDIHAPNEYLANGIFEKLDAMDKCGLEDLIDTYRISEVYHLVAVLSAKGELNPKYAWDLNMESLLNVLEIGHRKLLKIFWPSSIAVFGKKTQKKNTPQQTIMDPTTVYGMSKLAGERWCTYYRKLGLDVRSLRYPGIISYSTLPGGGTTDYAVDIFHHALKNRFYICFLKKDSRLPMMYMKDAIAGTLQLMESDADKIKVDGAYNLASMSFSPEEIANEIKKHIPEFEIEYVPDFRQEIADSWPFSIDDSDARKDWGWSPSYDLKKSVNTMLEKLSKTLITHR